MADIRNKLIELGQRLETAAVEINVLIQNLKDDLANNTITEENLQTLETAVTKIEEIGKDITA